MATSLSPSYGRLGSRPSVIPASSTRAMKVGIGAGYTEAIPLWLSFAVT